MRLVQTIRAPQPCLKDENSAGTAPPLLYTSTPPIVLDGMEFTSKSGSPGAPEYTFAPSTNTRIGQSSVTSTPSQVAGCADSVRDPRETPTHAACELGRNNVKPGRVAKISAVGRPAYSSMSLAV